MIIHDRISKRGTYTAPCFLYAYMYTHTQIHIHIYIYTIHIYATPYPKNLPFLVYELRYQEQFIGNLLKVDLEGEICEQYERYLTLAAKEEYKI